VLPDDGTIVIRTGRNPIDTKRYPDVNDILAYLLRQVGKAEQAGPG
jgi:hypothetical protein